MGLGKIGEFVARKFVELGFTVSGWSATKKEIPGVISYAKDELDIFLNNSNLKELLGQPKEALLFFQSDCKKSELKSELIL